MKSARHAQTVAGTDAPKGDVPFYGRMERTMIIAEFSIFPTSEGVSVSKYVKEVINVIKSSGLKHETGGISTTIEAPDMDTLLKLIKKCHEALLSMDVKRIHIDLKVDHRLDKDATIESKLKSLEKK